MHISLVVIRCQDLELSKQFYSSLGLEFVREQHGKSPVHYSTTLNGTVLELYPNNNQPPSDNVRLGFCIQNLTRTLVSQTVISRYQNDKETVYIVQDPDGRKVELHSL